MPDNYKLTHQGVRDLNDLGGKRINGKRNRCHHLIEDVVVVGKKEYQSADGPVFVNVIGCDKCGEVLGPEVEFEIGIKS
jgi:hypothetical protein